MDHTKHIGRRLHRTAAAGLKAGLKKGEGGRAAGSRDPAAPRVRTRAKIAALLASLTPKQRAFVDDPHRAKAALKTRRAGGTYAIAADLLATALQGGDGGYATVTSRMAKRVMWNGRSGLKALDRQFGLGFSFNTSDLIATAPDGKTTITLGGAETQDECEKYRGVAFKKFYIDEPASFKGHLEYLVDEVLEPTLLDEDGTLGMVGTPGRVLAGKFYEVTAGQIQPNRDSDVDLDANEDLKLADWSVHRWSLQDNPHLKHRDTFLARVFRRHGWDPTNPPPRAQREYFGLWVREESTLVYKFDRERNVYRGLPARSDWEYGLSIDLGSRDATAFRVTCFSRAHPVAYGIELAKLHGLTITDIAERIKGTRHMPFYSRTHAGPVIQGYAEKYPLLYIVVDTGGLGKMVVQELNERHGLSPQAEPAEKTSKLDFIEHFNDDLLHGRYQVAAEDGAVAEWELLQWAEDETKRAEDPRQANDAADATLYGWRRARHYWALAEDPRPLPGTREALDAEAKAWERKLEAEVLAEQRGEAAGQWWDG
jgi:Terminase large subunit, T4likevirus-type, N-terminal